MLVHIDEFEAPSQFTLEDIKMRVKGWLQGPVGKGYVFKAVSEHHITLTKTKNDLKICAGACISGIVFPVMGLMFSRPTTMGGFLLLLMTLMAVPLIMCVIGIGMYCLKPQKVVFVVQFSADMPLLIRVSGEGEVTKARYDYTTLRDAFFRESAPAFTRTDNW